MKRLRRTITVNHKEYEIFLGLKRVIYNTVTVYNIYFFPDNPYEKKVKPELIKKGFKSEKEALTFGKKHVKQIYISALNK